MENEKLLIKFLGAISIILSLGIIITVFAILGFNTYVSVSHGDKKIEVQATNSNSQTN